MTDLSISTPAFPDPQKILESGEETCYIYPMTGKFVLTQTEERGVPVFFIQGYFTEVLGAELKERTRPLIRAGKFRLVLDFSECPVINSLGIAAAMDLAFEILDEHQGRVAFSGANSIVQTALTIAGILPIVESYPTRAEAIEAVLEG